MPPTDSEEQKPPAAGEPFSRTWFVLWLLVFATAIVAARFVPFKPLHDVLNSFSWLTEKALKISKHLFESYGYLTVFLAPLLENTIFLGAIIPGTIIMLLAGVSAHDGLINLFPAIPLAIAGAWIGDTISYGAG